MLNHHLKQNIYRFCIFILLTAIADNALAVTVKVISESSFQQEHIPKGMSTKPIFESNNQLQIAFEVPHFIPAICPFKTNYPSAYKTLVSAPFIVMQQCIEKPYISETSFVALVRKKTGTIAWIYPLQVTQQQKTTYRSVLGASKDGVIIVTLDNFNIYLLDSITGHLIYPVNNQPPIIAKSLGIAIYDKSREVIYKFDSPLDKGAYQLNRIDLKTGSITTLATLPTQFLTGVPANPYQVALTENYRFLIILANVGSRIFPHDVLMIFDLTRNVWVDKHNLNTPFPQGSQFILKGNNIGVSTNNGSGTIILRHYVLIY